VNANKRGGSRASDKLGYPPQRAPLQSLFLAKVCLLENRLDELKLRLDTHKWMDNCKFFYYDGNLAEQHL